MKKDKVYSASLKKMLQLKLIPHLSQNDFISVQEAKIQKLEMNKKVPFKELIGMKKDLIKNYSNERMIQNQIDELMEKVTKDAEVNFEEPIHKKNKYKKYRIFTEPSSPKSSNPERQILPLINKKNTSPQETQYQKQRRKERKDLNDALKKFKIKRDQYKLEEVELKTKYVVKPTLRHYREGVQSLKKFQKLNF